MGAYYNGKKILSTIASGGADLTGYLTEEKASVTYVPFPTEYGTASSYLTFPEITTKGSTKVLYIAKGGQHGLTTGYANGWTILATATVTEQQIKEQWFNYGTITPARLSYAVKVGVTANKITLTDEEKAAAMAWLGVDTLIADLTARIAELENKVNG